METMKAIQVAAKGEQMKLVEIPIPQPGEGQVLLKVEACGICHGDSKVIEGAASSYPWIPGHEVVGIVNKVGTGVTKMIFLPKKQRQFCVQERRFSVHCTIARHVREIWLPYLGWEV